MFPFGTSNVTVAVIEEPEKLTQPAFGPVVTCSAPFASTQSTSRIAIGGEPVEILTSVLKSYGQPVLNLHRIHHLRARPVTFGPITGTGPGTVSGATSAQLPTSCPGAG